MDDNLALVLIVVMSVFLGWMKFKSIFNPLSWQSKVIEFWNDFINYLIAGLLAYFFIVIKIPLMFAGQGITIGDVILFIIFLFAVFGHLCVISYKISEAIEDFLKDKLKEKNS